MTPEQFLSLDQIKLKCGISGSSLDAQLTTFRAAAIGTIESRTRRNITDRSVKVRSPDGGDGRRYISFYIYDAAPIEANQTITYRTRQSTPGFNRDGSLSIPAVHWNVEADRVQAFNGSTDSNGEVVVSEWPERDRTIFYETALSVGIPDGEAPAEFEAAALMLIRELQEGSAIDQLPHNIVDLVLRDHVKPQFTATDEMLAEAGIE